MLHVMKIIFIYRCYLFSRSLDRRHPSSSVARLLPSTIDHNERIVTWINSPRSPENVFFSGRDYREGARYNNWKANEASAESGANISGGGGVYPRMTSSARKIRVDFIPPSVYFKIVPGFRVY